MTKVDDGAGSPETESVFRRYVATLGAQLIRLVLSLVTAGIVPRLLGPVAFGSYSYLMSTAATIRGFLDPSVQQTFFTFSSQERRTGTLTKLYGLFVIFQVCAILVLIALATHLGFVQWLWPGQTPDQIVWVTLLDWLLFLVIALQQLGDSKGLTVVPQMTAASVSVFTIFALVTLAWLGLLDLYTYIWLNLASAILAAAMLGRYLLLSKREMCWEGGVSGRVRETIGKWWRYASPLVMLEYYLLLVSFLGVYLIQVWYGSLEQGYYALGLRWSAVALVFMTAAIMIVWREIAAASAVGDRKRTARIFVRFGQLLFLLAAALSFWVFLVSKDLILLVAGEEYRAAVPVMMTMAFYPMAQTVGTLNIAAYKGMGRTREYRNLSIALSLPDLAVAYFLLAGPEAFVPGLGLGAVGMALKMTAWGLFSVQLLEWGTCRFLGLSFWREAAMKLATFAGLGACAFVSYHLARYVTPERASGSFAFVFTVTTVYWVLLAGVVMSWPPIVGVSRGELRKLVHDIRGRFAPRARPGT